MEPLISSEMKAEWGWYYLNSLTTCSLDYLQFNSWVIPKKTITNGIEHCQITLITHIL
jgi:hypothetical protein